MYQQLRAEMLNDPNVPQGSKALLPEHFDAGRIEAMATGSKKFNEIVKEVATERHQKVEESQGWARINAEGKKEVDIIGPDGKPHVGVVDTKTGKLVDTGAVKYEKPTGTGAQGQAASIRATTVMGSMEEAVRAAQNLGNMPVTSSNVFKLDKAHNIISAPQELLKGELTSDEAMDRNTHVHGIGYAMAVIEGNGTKPAVATMQQYDSKYNVDPGSSRYQSYMKLAQLKQDFQAKAASIDSSTMYSDSQKKEAKSIVEQMDKAVPYTVQQLQDIRYKGQARMSEGNAEFAGKGTPSPKPAATSSVEHNGKTYTKDANGDWIEQ
jgi:hypothetical protein